MQIIGEKRCTLYFAGIFGDHFARSFLQHSFGSPSELIAIHLIIRFEHERRSHGDLRGHVPTNPSRKSIESRERRRRRCSTSFVELRRRISATRRRQSLSIRESADQRSPKDRFSSLGWRESRECSRETRPIDGSNRANAVVDTRANHLVGKRAMESSGFPGNHRERFTGALSRGGVEKRGAPCSPA